MNNAEELAVRILKLTESENYVLIITQTGTWLRMTLSIPSGYKREADYINLDILSALNRFLDLPIPQENGNENS